jgi:RND family efflux transporter MFP subunit
MTTKKLIIIIIAVTFIGFIIYRVTAPSSVKAKKVSVITADVVRSVSASGYIKSPLEASVGFPVSGKIVSIYKKEGDSVKQGDLVAQVFNEDIYFDAESARKKKDSAQKTRDIYLDANQNHTDRVGGDSQYNLNFDKLTDDLRIYDNSYKSSLATLKKTYLYAPFDGTITSQPFDIGEIATSSSVIKMSNLGILEFQADLDQEDYKFVKPDQSTEIILDAYPQDKFIGKVQSVPSYVDEDSATKTFKLKITLENKNDMIVKGMTGDVSIIVSEEKNVRALPFDAIYSEGDKKYIWTVSSSNKLQKKFIEVNLEGDTLTSIKTELPEFVVIPDSSAKNVQEGNSVTF